MMPGVGPQIKKALIFVHRWMGVCLCLLFLTWFASGMVMMYWGYPGVTSADRLTRAPALDPSRIRVSPQQAYANLGTSVPPRSVLLGTFDGRPAYTFRLGGEERIVYADDGREQADFTPEMAGRIAAAWTRQPASAAKVETNTEEDQWTVSEEFGELRPMLKYSWPDGQQVYVSMATGGVVQYTTRASRLGAYLGAVPHWVYFTELRKRAEQWSRLVIWGSGLATAAAMLGIAIGVWVYSPSKRYRYAGAPSSIPYAGWKRWHLILGLTFGLFACTWAFSGMLSMDPFPRWQEGSSDETDARMAVALRGSASDLEAFAAKSPQEALAEVGSDFGAKELAFTSFAGEPFYLATGARNQTRIIPMRGEPFAEFPQEQIVAALRQAAQPAALTEVRRVAEYEAYYLDRTHQLPLPAIFVQLDDSERSSYYVDPKTARIVQGYNASSRRNRWFYHGLHSMDLPWLYRHRPAWDIVVLALLLGGGSLCVTSLLMAWGVLRRKLAPPAADGDAVLPKLTSRQ